MEYADRQKTTYVRSSEANVVPFPSLPASTLQKSIAKEYWMMATSKPTFVIVPGAWHQSSCYETLANHLEAFNFSVLIATHPSLNSAESLTATSAQDTEAVRNVLLPLIEDQAKNVMLVTHSYGGVSGSGAAHGLSTVSRAKAGKKGGVVGICFRLSRTRRWEYGWIAR